jgi:hypothetical protein
MPERASLIGRLCENMISEAWIPEMDMGGKAESSSVFIFEKPRMTAGNAPYMSGLRRYA